MPYPPHVKELAHWLDPSCWKSYSGKPVEIKRALDVRRTAALHIAQETVDAGFALNVSPNPERTPMLDRDIGLELLLHGFTASDRLRQAPTRYHSAVMKIEMMLHFATKAGPFTPEAQRTSPAYTKFIKQLLADGLVERPTKEEQENCPGWAYKASERGLAYVEGLKAVQLPVPVQTITTWGIPT
jgi:hypothetical protein